ncbi:MAG: DUF4166 domain-containing protein [Pseudomonadota bacterium]
MNGRTSAVFARLLGSTYDQLPASLRRFHAGDAVQQWSGLASVERGSGLLARIVANIFSLPAAGQHVNVQVHIQPSHDCEVWTRTFNKRSFSSVLRAGNEPGKCLLHERFGAFTFGIELVWNGGQLKFALRNWSFLGIRLPGILAPAGDTHETELDGQFCFHIEITHSFTGLIVAYRGVLAPVP